MKREKLSQETMLSYFTENRIGITYRNGKVYFKHYSDAAGKWLVTEYTRSAWRRKVEKASDPENKKKLFFKTLAKQKVTA